MKQIIEKDFEAERNRKYLLDYEPDMTKLVDFNNFVAKFIEENQPALEILNNLPH